MQSGIRRCSILIYADPQGAEGLEGGVASRPGTGDRKVPLLQFLSLHAHCKTPVLAFGSRPRERNVTLLLLERGTKGIRRTGWESREVLWGVKTKGQKENVR